MKPILTMLLMLLISCTVQAQSSPATNVAQRIAQKMTDTLALSPQQQQQIYGINMQLHASKAAVRTQYINTDSLGIYLQRIENTRDSLYRAVLAQEKYLLYKQKKATLISSN